jgi:hypothetical protein
MVVDLHALLTRDTVLPGVVSHATQTPQTDNSGAVWRKQSMKGYYHKCASYMHDRNMMTELEMWKYNRLSWQFKII